MHPRTPQLAPLSTVPAVPLSLAQSWPDSTALQAPKPDHSPADATSSPSGPLHLTFHSSLRCASGRVTPCLTHSRFTPHRLDAARSTLPCESLRWVLRTVRAGRPAIGLRRSAPIAGTANRTPTFLLPGVSLAGRRDNQPQSVGDLGIGWSSRIRAARPRLRRCRKVDTPLLMADISCPVVAIPRSHNRREHAHPRENLW